MAPHVSPAGFPRLLRPETKTRLAAQRNQFADLVFDFTETRPIRLKFNQNRSVSPLNSTESGSYLVARDIGSGDFICHDLSPKRIGARAWMKPVRRHRIRGEG